MRRFITSTALGLTCVLLLGTALPAQSLRDRLKQKAKEKIEQQSADKGDKSKKSDKSEKAKPTTEADSSVAPAEPEASATANDPPGKGAWLNYDFIPGDRTIWYEDFSADEVGDFPRRMRLKEGNFEVVDIKGKKMLRGVDGGWMFVVLPEKLPERFTLEMNFHSPSMGNPVSFQTTDSPFERSATFGCYSVNAWVASNSSGGPDNSGSSFQSSAMPGFVNCTFTVDNGRGIKGYINEHRTANAPQTHIELTDTLIIQLPSADADDPVLVSTLRIAAGGKKLYDVLAASGRVTTHGILFDTGLDRIRGESTPTLKEIGQMLKDHPELELTIEGHTDNVGQPAANLTLSQKRADAVKQYLVANFGIDAARLATKGYGDTKPTDKNDTPQGRQNNRRVELVKS